MVAPEHVSVCTHELEPAEWDNADVSRLALNVDPVKVITEWFGENRRGYRLGATAAGLGLLLSGSTGGSQEAVAGVFGSRDTIVKNSGKAALRVCVGEKDFWSNECVDPHTIPAGQRSWDMGVRDVESIVVPPRHKLLTYVYTDGEWQESISGKNCGSKKDKLVSASSLPAQRKAGAPTQTTNVKIADCPAYAKPGDSSEHNTPSSLGVKPKKNTSSEEQTSTLFTDWLRSIQNGGKSDKPKKKSSEKSSGGKSDPKCSQPWPLGLPDWQKEKQC